MKRETCSTRRIQGVPYAVLRSAQAAGGFTLIELMVVISIIAVLATIVGVNLLSNVEEGNQTATKAQIKNLQTALMAYKLKYKKFPSALQELNSNPKGIEFLDGKVPKDPWGNDYVYTLVSNSKYTIVSYGADGLQGGSEYDADISSDNLSGED